MSKYKKTFVRKETITIISEADDNMSAHLLSHGAIDLWADSPQLVWKDCAILSMQKELGDWEECGFEEIKEK